MDNKNRRTFLQSGGAALMGITALRRLRAQEPAAIATDVTPDDRNDRASGSRIRGIMLDAARLPESTHYYQSVIEFCAEWGLNTIQFRLTDDQGSALRFATVPDLVTHPDALTPEQAKGLVEFAASRGVDLIPEVESFGHTGYITRSQRYAHLLDADPQGSSEFTGVIPVLSESRELFEKLYREVSSIFPSPYIHAGCDEVNWGGSSFSRQALQTRTRAQIWAEYLNSLHRTAQNLRKQLIVWGDLVVHKEPEVLSLLDKKIIIMDWNYWDTGAISFHNTLSNIENSGHRAIGAPALISYRWGLRAGREQLRNIDAFTEAYFAAEDPGSLGVVLTNWVPTRYIQNSLWDGFAYAAIAFKNGPAAARASAFRLFVERHYKAEWNDLWDEAFQVAYDAAPLFGESASVSPAGLRLTTPWSSDAQLTQVLKKTLRSTNPFTRLRSLLVQLELTVLRNLADFRAFALSIACLELLFWRETVVLEQAAKTPPDLETAKLLIQGIADRDRDLADRLSRDWDMGRSPESMAKLELVYALERKDQLLYQWRQASTYSSFLAAHSDHFSEILKGGSST